MPATALKTIQINSTGEGTWGTLVAATRKIMGATDAGLKINEKAEVVSTIGYFGPGPISAELSQSGEAKIEGVMTYEDGPRLANGFMTAIASSVTTSGAPNVYSYTAPVSSTQACYTYTAQFGTTGYTYNAVGTVFAKLNVKGEAGDFWRYTIDAVAKQITSTGGLTVVADHTANPVRVANTAMYIDAFSTGTVGTTVVAGTVISFELDVNTNRHLKQFANSVNPGDWGEGKWEGSLKTVFELNATSKALIDELLGTGGTAVRRQIRIYATEGSSASLRSATLDFAGIKVDGEQLFGDRDGNSIVEMTWQGQYSTALGNWFKMAFQNGSTSTT